MALEEPYFVLAYYIFTPIDDPQKTVREQRAFLEQLDATARIYVSEEGINGQLCAARNDALKYIDWMHSHAPYKDVEFKIHEWHEQAFPRLTVKYRKKLVARDRPVDMSLTGKHMSPEEWKATLEKEQDLLLLDVRNSYEWKVGRFKGAELPQCDTFREFETYAESLKEQHDPKTKKVMMYCTGGIRCEIYSAYLKQMGFDNVYQLQGGIIKYGLDQGSKHWQGKLFVFDDRLTVPISKEPSEVIGKCHLCGTPSENYYNCASMDCNTLYLCCPDCVTAHKGCCSVACSQGSKLRPYQDQNPHKPFRRKHHYSF